MISDGNIEENFVKKWMQAKQKQSNILYTTTVIIRIWHWFIKILLSWKQSLHVHRHQINIA